MYRPLGLRTLRISLSAFATSKITDWSGSQTSPSLAIKASKAPFYRMNSKLWSGNKDIFRISTTAQFNPGRVLYLTFILSMTVGL